MTLPEFLLARIAEDEAVAQTASGPGWSLRDRDDGYFFVAAQTLAVASAASPGDRAHIARHDPARVLAECAAKRQIVEFHRPSTDHGERFDPYCDGCWHAGGMDGAPMFPCPTVRFLAMPYAAHPDYDETWKP